MAAQFPGEVQGRVVDAATGDAVPGARVSVDGSTASVRTGADGSFRMRGLEEGAAEVTVSAAGFLPETRTLEVRHGQVIRPVFRLHARVVELPALEVTATRGPGVHLDRETIVRSGARTVGELLETVPGVLIERRGPGGPEEVVLRGAGSGRVLVLVDGVPLNDPMTGGADLSSVPTASIREIQVFPGARGARHGPGALGGVVRIATGAPEAGAEARVGGGSLGEATGDGSLAGRLGPVGAEAHLAFRQLHGAFPFDRGDFLGGGEDRRRNGDLRQARVGLGLSSRPGELGGWQVRASADGLERGIPGKAYAPSPHARQSRARGSLQARWDGTLAGRLPVQVVGHHLRQEVRFEDPDPPLGLPFRSRTRLAGSGAEVEAVSRPLGGSGSRAGGGISIEHQSLDSSELEGGGRAGRTDLGVFVHAEMPHLPIPGSPSLAAALRTHRDGTDGTWIRSHEVTVGVPLGPVRIRASHRSSFSPPSAGDRFFREGVGVAPNPDLRAERVPQEVEVGASVRFRAGVLDGDLEAEVFRADVRDMIVWAPDFRFVWSPRNVDVRRRGGAVRGRVRHAASGISLGGDLSRTDVTYVRGGRDSGVQVIYRPRHSAGAFLALSSGPLRLEVRARHVGTRFPVAAPVNALDPFWTVGAVASTEWAAGAWRLQPLVRVDRLLDEKEPHIYAFPEPGRTFRFELRLAPGRSSIQNPSG